jgi:spore germination protein YaaH
MTYNFYNDSTGPGPQTPVDWYRKVLQYAVKSIPREKILVGLSTHGYDWAGEDVTGLTYPEVKERIERFQSEVTYDNRQASNMSKYEDFNGGEHTMWFENAKSIYEKMQLANNEFGINKFAFWRLSAEDADLWDRMVKN